MVHMPKRQTTATLQCQSAHQCIWKCLCISSHVRLMLFAIYDMVKKNLSWKFWINETFGFIINLNQARLEYFICKCGINIGLMDSVFTNGPGHNSSIPSRVIPKTQKMILDATLLNTQHYKVQIKGKVE